MSPIKKRIYEYLDFKGISKKVFFEKSGISSSNFRGKSAKSELGGDKIAKILAIYSDLNAYWLLTGKGSMIITETWKELSSEGNSVDENGLLISLNKTVSKKIPLVHRYAYSNFSCNYKKWKDLEFSTETYWNLDESEDPSNFLVFEHIGNSMCTSNHSGIMDGDFLLGKHISKKFWSQIIAGQNFAMLHQTKGLLVKQLHYEPKNSLVLNCISRNNNSDNFKVNVTDIIKLYEIIKLRRDFRG